MKELQRAANDALILSSGPKKIDSLTKAFEIFSQETVRLENAYDNLNEQFESLNLELQEANHKLQTKVAELDVMTDYLRSILDNIAQGILFIDLDGMITTYNRAAETILGISSRKAVFHRFVDIFKDDVFGFSMSSALEKQETTANYSISYTNPKNLHSELEVVTAFALKNTAEKEKESRYRQQGLIVMIRDITEMRHLQIQALRADRMKMLGEMAAQVAHEIRNPLGGIKGFAALLKRDLAEHPHLQQMAGYIVEGTDNLNALVSQVLSFSRPVQVLMERIDLVGLIQDIKQHVLADPNTAAHPNGISITVDSSSKRILISLDSALFKAALLNVLVNAIQAMPEGGEILITIRESPKHIILSVSDTGTGISEENISKLYTLFFTTKPEGNGLGLVETQKVVQAHGGTIDVTSTEGKGTTFVIKLPKTSHNIEPLVL
ncbi:MAG: ATP-binding protein [Parachlamydiaceae bacterium]